MTYKKVSILILNIIRYDFWINQSKMNLDQFKRLKFQLRNCADHKWLNEKAKKIQNMNFKDGRIEFLGLNWKGKLKTKNELFLYSKNEDLDCFRIRVHSFSTKDENFITAELRKRVEDDVYIVMTILQLKSQIATSETMKIPESNEDWIIGDLKNLNALNQREKKIEDWTIEDVHHWIIETLKLEKSDANLLMDERIDGESLMQITEDDLKELNMKMGPRKKLIKAIRSFQRK